MNIKIKVLISVYILLFSAQAFSSEQYANANVLRIEACGLSSHQVLVYLHEVSGTTPSAGNGCSNDITEPFVRIASDDYPAGLNNSLLSIALSAFATGKTVRIRYDDTNNQAISIAINY
jgi:hypothetical protein